MTGWRKPSGRTNRLPPYRWAAVKTCRASEYRVDHRRRRSSCLQLQLRRGLLPLLPALLLIRRRLLLLLQLLRLLLPLLQLFYNHCQEPLTHRRHHSVRHLTTKCGCSQQLRQTLWPHRGIASITMATSRHNPDILVQITDRLVADVKHVVAEQDGA